MEHSPVQRGRRTHEVELRPKVTNQGGKGELGLDRVGEPSPTASLAARDHEVL